jgi:hypothetical protein
MYILRRDVRQSVSSVNGTKLAIRDFATAPSGIEMAHDQRINFNVSQATVPTSSAVLSARLFTGSQSEEQDL